MGTALRELKQLDHLEGLPEIELIPNPLAVSCAKQKLAVVPYGAVGVDIKWPLLETMGFLSKHTKQQVQERAAWLLAHNLMDKVSTTPPA